MIINGTIIEDVFMFTTIKDIACESGITDTNTIVEVYKELYDKTDAQGKSWNCKKSDDLLSKKQVI